jgi:ferredoxin
MSFNSIEDVYRRFDQVGCCSFATLDGHGGVESRTAHFFAYGDEGLYLRTMTVKPFYRQLREGGKLTACGEYTAARVSFDDDNLPKFQPGFMVRVSGSVRELDMDEVLALAAHDRNFNVAIYDIDKYPETRVFVLNRGHAELYDYDFNMVHRDHKILRERFCFGGETWVAPGLTITQRCDGCGVCLQACTHKAIFPGDRAADEPPYQIHGERCDECGNCYHACPAGAVAGK